MKKNRNHELTTALFGEGHFERHRERMRYRTLRKRKLVLGSGAIESAIRRVVNQRVKSDGSFWLRELLAAREFRACASPPRPAQGRTLR